MYLAARRRPARLSSRILAAAACILTLATCRDNLGPRGMASIGLRPVFQTSPSSSGLALNGLRVIIIRPPSDTLARVARAFPVDSQSLTLDIPVPLKGTSEDLEAHLDLYSGTTLLFSGVQTVHVALGQTSAVADVPVAYEGPGSNLTQLAIAPQDTFITPGAAFDMRAAAADVEDEDVPQFHVAWKASAGSIDANGHFASPTVAGVVQIIATTPGGPADSTYVYVGTTAGQVRQWTGITSYDWDTKSNWLPQVVPGPADSVEILATAPNSPYRDGDVSIGALVVHGNDTGLDVDGNLHVQRGIALPDSDLWVYAYGGNLTAGSLSLAGYESYVETDNGSMTITGTTTISGLYADVYADGAANSFGPINIPADQAYFEQYGGTVGPIAITGNSSYVSMAGPTTINGAVTIGGSSEVDTDGDGGVTVNGNVSIAGTGGVLALYGNAGGWTINGNLSTTGSGRVSMYSASDSLRINGNASFAGGDESGYLYAGSMFVKGNFTQAGASIGSFAGVGTHTVYFNGTGAQTINFANPGFGTSHFQNVVIANTAGQIQITSDVFATGTVGVTAGAVRTLSGNGSTLYTNLLNIAGFTFNNLLLNYNGGPGALSAFTTTTFSGYSPTATVVTISDPGAASAYLFSNLTFTVSPTSGAYISATDNNTGNGQPLTIDMVNPNPASAAGHLVTSGGAVINWPQGSGNVRVWNGSQGSAWTNPANWTPAVLPTSADSVYVPNGLPIANNPTLTGRVTVAAMFQDGRLDISGGTLQVTRRLTSGAGLNRFTQLLVAGDSLIVGDSLTGPLYGAVSGTVAVIGGSIGTPLNGGFMKTVLNGTGTQTIPQNTGTSGGWLVISKPSGTVNFTAIARYDSVLVTTATPITGAGIWSQGSFSTVGPVSLASLEVAGLLTATNTYSVVNTTFDLPNTPYGLPVLTYANVVVNGPTSNISNVFLGRTVIAGNLALVGLNGGSLSANGYTIVVGGNLTTNGLNTLRLRMANLADSVIVGGSVDFGGPTSASPGDMTAGVLVVGANFTQSVPYGGVHFQGTGTHTTVLTGLNPTVKFATPGLAGSQDRFNNLVWAGTGTLTIDSTTYVTGAFTTLSTGTVTVHGRAAASQMLQIGSRTASGATIFDNLRVAVVQSSPTIPIGITNTTFQNMASTVNQLTVQHPGWSSGAMTLNNMTFSTLPTSGLYVNAQDTDGPTTNGPLTLTFTGASPATGNGFTAASSGAVINW